MRHPLQELLVLDGSASVVIEGLFDFAWAEFLALAVGDGVDLGADLQLVAAAGGGASTAGNLESCKIANGRQLNLIGLER